MSFANSNKREAFMFYMLFGYKNSDTEALDFIMNDLKQKTDNDLWKILISDRSIRDCAKDDK